MINSTLMLVRAHRHAALLIGMILTVSGCGGDVVPSAPRFEADPFWAVELNVHRIVMSTVAPYDTFRLVATPRTAAGHALSRVPIFAVSDQSVSVTADGLVTAHKLSNRSYVVAVYRDTAAGLTRTDTAFITVTNDPAPPRLATFILGVPPGDSTKVSMDSLKTLMVAATDSSGNDVLADMPSWFISRNPIVADVDREGGVVRGMAPKQTVWIVSEIGFYGVVKRDSLQMTIGYPLLANVGWAESRAIGAGPYFDPSVVSIGPGGTVTFVAQFVPDLTADPNNPGILASTPFDVQFDNPSAAQISPVTFSGLYLLPQEQGNISQIQIPGGKVIDAIIGCNSGQLHCGAARRFTVPGKYPFHDSRTGESGLIIVE